MLSFKIKGTAEAKNIVFYFILISLLWLDNGDVIVPWCFGTDSVRRNENSY